MIGLELTGRQRRRLMAAAHGLKPLVQVGKAGVTDGLIGVLDAALSDHELVKVRFIGHKDERTELSAAMAEGTRSHLVGIIGNTAVLYRESPDPAKRRISPGA
jgi:RNA-binding protein